MTRPTNLDVIIHLRKSRKDIEEEKKALETGVPFDTLDKHKRELMELVRREQHNVIRIFEEIVSGEFLSERPEAQEMLRNVEDGECDAVIVMDLDRLGRGDMIDAGTIFRAFKYSETLIITPTEVIDCNAEGAELLFGVKSIIAREELKQINKRLQGGRRRAVKDGRHIAKNPPYGYLRDENLKLYPHPEEAPVVKKIFELLAEGSGRYKVIDYLMRSGYKAPSNKDIWEQSTISYIVKNEVYLGHLVWGKQKHTKRNGKRVRKNLPPELWTRHDNAHEPIVSQELFDRANEAHTGRLRVSRKEGTAITNPLAGIAKCGVCGRTLTQTHSYDRPNPQIRCNNPACKSIQKGSLTYLFEEKLISSLEELVEQRKMTQSELNNSAERKNKNEERILALTNYIQKATTELNEQHSMRETTFEMLERKVYTEELFLQRHKIISDKIKQLESEIEKSQEEIAQLKIRMRMQAQLIPKIHKVIQAYKSLEDAEQKNNLLKTVIEKVMYIRKKEWLKPEQFELEVILRFPT
ncbi:serine recombinase [Brevibacillus halotolerans]|nr:serine recombinase [Brevibacillus halotolerans]